MDGFPCRAGLLALALWIAALPGARAGADDEAGQARKLADDLHSRYLEDRETAKRSLIRLGAAAEPIMLEAIHDPDLRVQLAAAEVLAALASPRAIEALLDAVENGEAELVEAVPPLFARLGTKAREALARRLARRPDEGALRAVETAFLRGDVERVLSGLITERYSYGFYSGQFQEIEKIGAPAVPILMAMFTDPTYAFQSTDPKRRHIMRSLAGEALADMKDRSIIPALQELIESTTSPAELAFDRQELEDTLAYILFKLGEKQHLTDMAHRLDNYLQGSSGRGELTPRLVSLLVRMGDYGRAEQLYRQLLEDPMRVDWAYYNLACLYAIQNKKDDAIDHLERAIDGGFGDVDWIKQDGDLRNLRGDPRYEELIRRAERRDRTKRPR